MNKNQSDTWYSLDLGDEPEAYDIRSRIQEDFTSIFVSSAAMKKYKVAAFSLDHPETHHLIIYFPPSVSEFAMSWGAAPCKKPSKTALVPILADKRALAILFPDDCP